MVRTISRVIHWVFDQIHNETERMCYEPDGSIFFEDEDDDPSPQLFSAVVFSPYLPAGTAYLLHHDLWADGPFYDEFLDEGQAVLIIGADTKLVGQVRSSAHVAEQPVPVPSCTCRVPMLPHMHSCPLSKQSW